MIRKPNLFIVGYPKTGTTALYHYLSRHPDVFACPHKEPGGDAGMSGERMEQTFGSDSDRYLALFAGCGSQKIIYDGTPMYIFPARAARILWEFNPEARIIIMIREPLDYLISMAFQLTRNTGRHHDIRRDIARGQAYTHIRYAEQVGRFIQQFGSDRVKVIIYDDYEADNLKVLGEICDFLGIDRVKQRPVERVHVSAEPDSAPLCSARSLYRNVFIYSAFGVRFRRAVRSAVGIRAYDAIKRFFGRISSSFLKPKPRPETVFTRDEIEEFKRRNAVEIGRLADLIGRDLAGLWAYPRTPGA